MAYLVRLKVYSSNESQLEARVRAAIQKSGGVVKDSEGVPITKDAMERRLTFFLKDTRLLPRVVGSVEAIKGAAVVSVSEPRPVRDEGRP